MPKQIHDLALSDLREWPIWAYLSEDEPEAVDDLAVTPHTPGTFDFETMYVAFATFTLAGGLQYLGYVHPEQTLSLAQPCMFVSERRVTFWSGICLPDATYIADVYRTIGVAGADVFPIRWHTEYAPNTEPSSGIIEGFGYITNDGEHYVR